ncbi:Monoterpene epsilon-lactone hydrolase, partial [Zancudomyces culisetae]
MSDLYGCAFPAHLGKEQQDLYEAEMVAVMEAAKKSFLENGPTLPSWTLEAQVAITRARAEVVRLLKKCASIGMTPETFDAEKIGTLFKPLRTFTARSIEEKGKFERHIWKIEADNLFISPKEVFDELAESDKKLAMESKPRELYTEVVVSNEFVKAAEEKGIDSSKLLGVAPLSENEKIIIHYHGGGFCIEGPAICRGLAADLSKETGYRVFLPSYRLAPENPFPKPIYDGYLFYKHMLNLGYKHENIIISGDSAG